MAGKNVAKRAYGGFLWLSGKLRDMINFIILSAVYFLGIGLTSVFAKLFGKRFLNVKKGRARSYWVKKHAYNEKKEDFLNQF